MKIATAMAVACLSIVGLAAGSDAQAVMRHYELNIPKQSLDTALRDLAQQTGLQIALFSDTIDGNTVVGPVLGTQSAEEALKTLLLPSGLSFKVVSEGTIAVLNPKDSQPVPRANQERKVSFWSRLRLAQADTGSSQSGDKPGSSPEASENKSETLEEVVVTAQKREERLQDVPISVSVLRGQDLDQSTAQGISEALTRVPGIAMTSAAQGGGTNLSMRGVTASGGLFAGSSPISYYLDSIPFGFVKSAIAPDPNAYDMERIEVLRGPQGTLYGASALTGVVRVLTHDADLNRFEIKGRTSASSTDGGGDNYRGDLAINAPLITGKLAARAVVGYQNLSGWIDRPTARDANDTEVRNLRLKVNAQPTDRLSIGLSAWASRTDFGAPSLANDTGQNPAVLDESGLSDYDVYGLKIGYDFSAFSLTSTTSYLDFNNEGALDLTPIFNLPVTLFTGLDSQVFTQEVNLSSAHEGPWRWTAGAIYRDAEDRLVQTVNPVDYSDLSKSFAVFGELTRIFMDGKLELTGGWRYFEDDVTQIERVPAGTTPPARPLYRASRNFSADSPRVILNWLPSDHLTIYGSYAEGFRSGFNQNANVIVTAPEFPPLDPDNLKNYEVGAKGNILGGRLSIDAAVYYIDWESVQQTVLVLPPSGIQFTALINGTSASGVGVDFALATRPVDGLELGANIGWSDLTMDGPVFSRGVLLFNEGDRLNGSAEYTYGAFADYVFPLGGSGFKGRFSASGNYTSERSQRAIVGGTQRSGFGDAILISRAGFAVEAPDHWTATLFVDNLNNEKGAQQRQPNPLFSSWSDRVRPRTIGVQFEVRF